MNKISCLAISLLLSLVAGCRSERVAYYRLPAAPARLAAHRLPSASPPAEPLASPAPTAPAAATGRDRRAARPRRQRFTAAAEVPPPAPAADPAAATLRQRRQPRLRRLVSQRDSTQPGLLAIGGLLLGLSGLVVLIKLIFGTSFLLAFGVVAGLVLVALAVLVLLIKKGGGFGWH